MAKMVFRRNHPCSSSEVFSGAFWEGVEYDDVRLGAEGEGGFGALDKWFGCISKEDRLASMTTASLWRCSTDNRSAILRN